MSEARGSGEADVARSDDRDPHDAPRTAPGSRIDMRSKSRWRATVPDTSATHVRKV
jgi:hypothetical protein